MYRVNGIFYAHKGILSKPFGCKNNVNLFTLFNQRRYCKIPKRTKNLNTKLSEIILLWDVYCLRVFNRFLFLSFRLYSRRVESLVATTNNNTLLQAYKVWTKLLRLPSHHHRNTIATKKSINTHSVCVTVYKQESARMSQSLWEGVKHCRAKADRKLILKRKV